MNSPLLGIEIGGTKLQFIVGTSTGGVLRRERFTVEAATGAAALRAQIESQLPKLVKEHRPIGIGVGYGGPVDWETGRICRSHQVSGWDDFPLGDWLQQLGGVRATVDNDANCGALAEALCGAGRGCNPVFYVTLGSGVGGGLVIGEKIFHGVKPGESEIGHVRLDREGTIIESRCSGWAVDAKVRALATAHPQSILARQAGCLAQAQARALVPALAEHCALAKGVLDELAGDLAFGLSHVVHLMHPEIIVLGGGLALLGEPLRAGVEAALPKFLMQVFAPGPRIALAELGEEMVPIGALLLASAAMGR